MKKKLVETTNWVRFTESMDTLLGSAEGVSKMGLVFGEPGLGKTQAALKFLVKNNAIFLRAKTLMTGRWLLAELVSELGLIERFRTSDLFRQVQESLIENPRPILVDEVDYLCGDSKTIETLRDIHDVTNTPIILIGMGSADKKLKRYPHLYDRLSVIMKFTDFVEEDIKVLASELCEAPISPEGLEFMFKHAKRFRPLIKLFYKAERVYKVNNKKLEAITNVHLENKVKKLD